MTTSSPAPATKKIPWNKILNEQEPIRIAVLGGSQTGKSSFITKLNSGIFQETYYPTGDFSTTLLKFKPVLRRSRLILDEMAGLKTALPFLVNDRNNIVFSSHLQNVFDNNDNYDLQAAHLKINELNYNMDKLAKSVCKLQPVSAGSLTSNMSLQTNYYAYYYATTDAHDYTWNSSIDDYYKPLQITNSSTTIKNTNRVLPNNLSQASISSPPQQSSPLPYEIPRLSPILVELVDTPAFNPNLVVPFLELSLGARLGEEFLHNLSRDPRLPIATKALLIGSGAGELNGSIDGYVLTYSAIPSMNPPSYETDNLDDSSSFNLLYKIRSIIHESWKSYKLYLRQNEIQGETDVFSLTSSIKHLWKLNKQQQQENQTTDLYKRKPKKKQKSPQGSEIDLTVPPKSLEFEVPISDTEIPPMIIACTHSNDFRASPLLVQQGKQLARQWNCSFVALDNETGFAVEETLSLLLREIIEREKRQKAQLSKRNRKLVSVPGST